MMKNKIYISMLAILLLIQGAGRAAFKDNGWGARPAGMGGAFTAVADDANAPLYNPAGIMQLKAPELSFMYSKLYTGLDEVKLNLNYLAYVIPTSSIGSFGLNWASFAANGLYREDTFTFSYAQSLNAFAEFENEYLIGTNVKYLRNSFTLDRRTQNDPVFANGSSADAITADLGFLVNFYEESIGLSVKNINEPDVGLKTKEVAYREYRLGFAYLLGEIWKLEESLPAAELSYRNKEVEYHIGWENWFARRTLALRFGGNQDEVDLGFGYNHDIGSSGIGLEFNYALLWPLEIEDTTGSHRASVSMRFGGKPYIKERVAEPVKAEALPLPAKPTMIQQAKKIIKSGVIKEETRGLAVNFSSQVMFDIGKSTVKARALETLDELATLLNEYKENKLLIEGHTDSVGSSVMNQRLSEARAQAVSKYLIKNGVAEMRIETIGFGETKPIADNKSVEGKARNRRVEIIILKAKK
ncbi:MAG: OmpA family protein [bacterium]